MSKPQFQYLVNHRYVVEKAGEALREIQTHLAELGYMEDNNKMIHDYLHFMLVDILDKNNEIYLTEDTIRSQNGGVTPDFIIRRGVNRPKTLIVDIYVGDRPSSEVKTKYKTLGFFADVCVVTQHDFQRQLKPLLPIEDIDYLYKHFQIFLVEYHYWRACIKLQKVLVNEVDNVRIKTAALCADALPAELALTSPDRTIEQVTATSQYVHDLAAYGQSVAKQDNL